MTTFQTHRDPASPSPLGPAGGVPALGLAALTSTLEGTGGARRVRRRSIRVVSLIVVILAVSLGDLYLTLTFLRSGGMGEGNPFARAIMAYNCPWLLAAWKMLLVALNCSILFATRRARSAELAAWICAGVMVWLTFQWLTYAEHLPQFTDAVSAASDHEMPDWVRLDP